MTYVTVQMTRETVDSLLTVVEESKGEDLEAIKNAWAAISSATPFVVCEQIALFVARFQVAVSASPLKDAWLGQRDALPTTNEDVSERQVLLDDIE